MNNCGRTTDGQFWKALYSYSTTNWGWYSDSSSGYGNGYNDLDYNTRKTKRKHEFSPILLVYSTVYDCKHCKRKKEDCKYEYCDDEDNPPGWDIAGW